VSAKLGRGVEETFLQITKKMMDMRGATGGRGAGMYFDVCIFFFLMFVFCKESLKGFVALVSMSFYI